MDAGDANGDATNATPKKKATPRKRKNGKSRYDDASRSRHFADWRIDEGETATPKSKKSKKTSSSSEERETERLEKEDGEALGLIKPEVDSDTGDFV